MIIDLITVTKFSGFFSIKKMYKFQMYLKSVHAKVLFVFIEIETSGFFYEIYKDQIQEIIINMVNVRDESKQF